MNPYLDLDSTWSEITSLQKTRESGITMAEKGCAKAATVREAMVKSNQIDVLAFAPKRIGVIHVKDLMDIEATKEDVAESISIRQSYWYPRASF